MTASAHVAHLLADAAHDAPDRPAFVHGATRWTYADAAHRASRCAERLAAAGVGPGDVVAWIGDNTPAAALAYFGTAWAGAVLAPLHLRLTDADLRRVLAHAGAKVVLVEAAHRARAEGWGLPLLDLGAWAGPDGAPSGDARPARPPVARAASDPAHLYYTSGSTGTPKGVVLTHGNVVTHARLAAAALDLTARDVWLHAAPMFHLADAWATFAITLVRGEHRFVPHFREPDVLDAFASGVTVTNLVPTMWHALVRHPETPRRVYPSLRLLLSGGAAIAPDVVRRVRALFGAEYAQTYGLTETSPYLTISRLTPEEARRPEAEVLALLTRAGRPMAGVEVAVVDADGRPVAADGVAVGEVVARGATVTPGYLRNPEADAAAFRDGWFRTGDLARVHPDGRIDLADRTGDVVNSGGEKVFTTDVERALSGAPGVAEVLVVGTPDPHWGQVVTAVVVPEGAGPTLEGLKAHVRGTLADFKVPRRLVLVDALPRTASGKLSKREARALAAARLAPPPA
ncbi:MAG: AMP-binding protein [Planctomycetota bacterium]